MASRDDEYWHGVMVALSNEYLERSAWLEAMNRKDEATGWREAALELKATADQALETNTTASRLIEPNKH